MTPLVRRSITIFTVALFLRLGALAIFPTQTALDGDQIDYDRIAFNLANGDGFSFHPGVETSTRAPGYIFYLSAHYKLFGHAYAPVRVGQALLGALSAWLLFWIVRAAFDDRIGAAAGWLCALYPVFIHYEARIQSETLMVFLVLLSLPGMLVYVRERRLGPLALSGLVIGLATLTRPGTLLLPLGMAPLLAVGRPLDWKGPLLYLAVFAAVLFPWQYRNHSLFDHWSLASRGPGFGLFVTGLMTQGVPYEEGFRRYTAMVLQPRYQEPAERVRGSHPYMELEKRMQAEGKAAIKEAPFKYLWIVVKRFPRFWITSHSAVFGVDKSVGEYKRAGAWGSVLFRYSLLGAHALLWALALFGLYAGRKSLVSTWPILFVPVYFTIHTLFDIVPRYHIPALPMVFAFAAAGGVSLYDRMRPWLKKSA